MNLNYLIRYKPRILDEFALSCYLIKLKLEGHEVPNELPMHLIPPSKRGIRGSSSQSSIPQSLDE